MTTDYDKLKSDLVQLNTEFGDVFEAYRGLSFILGDSESPASHVYFPLMCITDRFECLLKDYHNCLVQFMQFK